jgi:hypothetical protein
MHPTGIHARPGERPRNERGLAPSLKGACPRSQGAKEGFGFLFRAPGKTTALSGRVPQGFPPGSRIRFLSPSIHKFGNEFIPSGLSAEGAFLAMGPEKYVSVFANRST